MEIRFEMSNDISAMIGDIRSCLATQPVERAWLFGSYSRGEQQKDSDVDILVQYTKGSVITLFTIGRIIHALSQRLGRRVDVVEEGQLMPFAVESVDKDKVLIYERAH